MKSQWILMATLGVMGIAGATLCDAGNRPQPTAPPIPPSWKQPPAPQPHPQPPAQPNPQQSPEKDDASKDGKDSRKQHPDRRYPNQYPYGNPNGYGQPQAGIYYPGGSPSGINGNPNAAPNTNGGNGSKLLNNDPAPVPSADKPAPTVVAPAPPTPPDPELIEAQQDVTAAMDHLRESLLKTSPEYQAAVADKKAAQEASAVVHATEGATQDQIVAAATRVLDAARHVGQLERDAAVTDQSVQDAQSKLKTALAAHSANVAANAAAAAIK